jgi:hypothetical protein
LAAIFTLRLNGEVGVVRKIIVRQAKLFRCGWATASKNSESARASAV